MVDGEGVVMLSIAYNGIVGGGVLPPKVETIPSNYMSLGVLLRWVTTNMAAMTAPIKLVTQTAALGIWESWVITFVENIVVALFVTQLSQIQISVK